MQNTRDINPSINLLKILAIVLMTIDHIGFFLFPNQLGWRAIGRLAAPIFAYLIVVGVQNTRNWRDYAWRLLILALVSQVVFWLTVQQPELNIIFNFLGVVILLRGPIWAKFLLVPAYILLDIEYSWLILALAAIYHLISNKTAQVMLVILAGVLYGAMSVMINPGVPFYGLQTIAGFSALLIFAAEALQAELRQRQILTKKLPKYLLYVYYPAHWLVIYIIYSTIN